MAKNYTFSTKLLALVGYLESQPGHWAPIRQAATDLQLSVPEIRDIVTTASGVHWNRLDPLESLVIDIDADDDGDLVLREDLGLGILLDCDPNTAYALTVALGILAEGLSGPELAVAQSALTKLARSGGLSQPAPIDTLSLSPDDEVREVVCDAIAAECCLDLTYTREGGTSSRRLVAPVSLEREDSWWYLTAWDPASEGMRTFRLDRIGEITLTDQPARMPDTPPQARRRRTVVVTVRPEYAGLADDPEVEAHRVLPDGSVELTLKVYDLDWAVRFICSLGAAVVKVSPPELALAVRQRARALL